MNSKNLNVSLSNQLTVVDILLYFWDSNHLLCKPALTKLSKKAGVLISELQVIEDVQVESDEEPKKRILTATDVKTFPKLNQPPTTSTAIRRVRTHENRFLNYIIWSRGLVFDLYL